MRNKLVLLNNPKRCNCFLIKCLNLRDDRLIYYDLLKRLSKDLVVVPVKTVLFMRASPA